MIKVLHVCSDSNIGGAGRLLVNYLKHFDRDEFLIKVALPEGSLLEPAVSSVGYEVISIGKGADKSFSFGAMRQLKKLIRKEKFDIVHTHSSLSGRLAAFFAGVRVRMYTRHCAYDPPRYMTMFPFKQINGAVNNLLATKIIAVADAAKENLTDTGVDDKKISVIINGVDPLRRYTETEKLAVREQYGIPADAFVLSISARLEKVKGHEYFIDAAAKLVSEYKNLRFVIMGMGAEEEHLKGRVMELGLEDYVIFTGFVDDVTPIVNITDLNINCSYGTETSSLALSEAMSVGVPAIATTYGGNPYMVRDGENGLLVPIKDADALSEAVKKVLFERELYNKMRETAYEHYRTKFTAHEMTKRLEDIYREELSS